MYLSMTDNTDITPEVFENLLYLSRLSPHDSDMETLAQQVGQIISYFDILKKFDCADGGTSGIQTQEKALRSDTIQIGTAQSDLKKMTREYMDGYFRVPKVLGSGV